MLRRGTARSDRITFVFVGTDMTLPQSSTQLATLRSTFNLGLVRSRFHNVGVEPIRRWRIQEIVGKNEVKFLDKVIKKGLFDQLPLFRIIKVEIDLSANLVITHFGEGLEHGEQKTAETCIGSVARNVRLLKSKVYQLLKI
jgi:hypothetical protein